MVTAVQTIEKPLIPEANAFELVRKKLWRSKPACISAIVLICLYLSAAFADFLAPYSMGFADPDLANAPPTKIHCVLSKKGMSLPFVCLMERSFDVETYKQVYVEKKTDRLPIKLLVRGEEYKLFGFIPGHLHLFGVETPGRIFLLGSDINGRDNFSRLLFGSQKSLTIGFLGLLIMFPLGILYGGIAGSCGGIVDNVMMRIAEAIMSMPGFYLLIALAAILPAGMSSTERFALITIILSFIGWAGLARVVRGMVLAIKQQEFVEAARAVGQSEWKNMLKHVLPQTTSFVIVAATLQVPNFILSESGLSFIGLGIQQPDASWGNMLKAALDNANDLYNQPWLLAPGLLIFLTILCFNTVGDVCRDILDPKSAGI
jgi:peptide/nickel transport system permease protein